MGDRFKPWIGSMGNETVNEPGDSTTKDVFLGSWVKDGTTCILV